jgi:lysophospholipase L1-like esterase
LRGKFCLTSLLALLLCASALSQPVPNSFALKNGDRVVFYGDSITAQRLYTRFAEEFIVSRYPDLHISFYNAGVSGDTVEGGHAGDMETRLKRDVLPFHPTVVTIMLGMNDGRYATDYKKNFEDYAAGYRKLIVALRQEIPGVRLFLICPSPYDEIAHKPLIPGYNTVMLRYGQFVVALGRQEHIPVIDFNEPLMDAIRAGMGINPAMAGTLLPGLIHPSPAGHWIMAAALAKGWNANLLISSVTIDGKDATVSGEARTAVTNLRNTNGALSWSQLDEAVPLPLVLEDPTTQFLFKVSDMAAFDQQVLRVRGLTAQRYELSIDGKKIACLTREELSGGVNLARYETPMEQQAQAIDWTADDRAKLSGTRFDLLTEREPGSHQQEAVAALDRLDQQMIQDEYRAATPKPHTFELTPEAK